jgi:hypothetical protein
VVATAHHRPKVAMVVLPHKDIHLHSRTTALRLHSSTEDIITMGSLLPHRSSTDTTRDHHHHSSNTGTMDLHHHNSNSLRDQV